MIQTRSLIAPIGVCLALLLSSCGEGDSESAGHAAGEESGEHSEGAESGGGEESGTQYGKADSYDETRAGARLLVSYEPDEDAFVGTVENTTDAVLDEVRIEVHLSNGVELGPTTPGDLRAGETVAVSLLANGENFETWSAHPEVGRNEPGHEGEEEGEHGEGGESGEHDGDGS